MSHRKRDPNAAPPDMSGGLRVMAGLILGGLLLWVPTRMMHDSRLSSTQLQIKSTKRVELVIVQAQHRTSHEYLISEMKLDGAKRAASSAIAISKLKYTH